MHSLWNKIWRRSGLLVAGLAVIVLALLPEQSQADNEQLGLNVGHGRIGHREGDPLDTNDNPGGPDPIDERLQTDNVVGRSIFGSDFWAVRILFVPQYNGATVTFKVIFLSDANLYLEARDAK